MYPANVSQTITFIISYRLCERKINCDIVKSIMNTLLISRRNYEIYSINIHVAIQNKQQIIFEMLLVMVFRFFFSLFFI